jgi:hypothetical protein
VQFEITEPTREAIVNWINRANLRSEDHLFSSRLHGSPHLSTRDAMRPQPVIEDASSNRPVNICLQQPI